MSTAAMGNSGGIEESGFTAGMSCIIFRSPEIRAGDGRLPAAENVTGDKREGGLNSYSSCFSWSSIGKNSDISGKSSLEEDESGDGEVQSSYKGPLNSMEALEEALPLRRGISSFYSGKSKSFTSLADAAASSSSIKGLTKPQNAHTRKRRNLLACSLLCGKNRSFPRRMTNLSRTTLAMAVSASVSTSSFASETNTRDSCSNSNLTSTSQSHCSSPYQQNQQSQSCADSLPSLSPCFSAYRSFSSVDLQQCDSVAAIEMPSSSTGISGDEAHLERIT